MKNYKYTFVYHEEVCIFREAPAPSLKSRLGNYRNAGLLLGSNLSWIPPTQDYTLDDTNLTSDYLGE